MEIHTKYQDIGALGEDIAVQYLTDRGYAVVSRNYRKKWGEIDIIVTKGKVVHFVEVKCVSYETRGLLQHSVTHETWRPEELVHHHKLHQIRKVAEAYIQNDSVTNTYQVDVIGVRCVPRETFATVLHIQNIEMNI